MALNTEAEAMYAAANQLDQIKQDVVNALGQYLTMNQNLTGPGLNGTAATASLATSEDITNTGRQVGARFDHVIQMMRKGAHDYQSMDEQNRARLANIRPA
ncbi:hypothetical protein [Mycobacterium sp.]|uniref:hypothetical protein n=1 Tax=Mycobacterium sp. TaxID=1785 RepID=UPI002C98EEA1|nr:hypothetical protein [Mycobacterium sp.]HME48073.1 hypothetical protein [Mycobacterium sp.]